MKDAVIATREEIEVMKKNTKEYWYQQGRVDERRKIIEIIDSADDNSQAMYLLGKYIISEGMKAEIGE